MTDHKRKVVSVELFVYDCILLFISKRRSALSALRTTLADRRGVQRTTRCVKCDQRDGGLWPVAADAAIW